MPLPNVPEPDLNDPVVAEAHRQHEERVQYNRAHGLDPSHPETFGKAPAAAPAAAPAPSKAIGAEGSNTKVKP